MNKDKNMVKIIFLMPTLVGGGAERTLINFLQKVDYSKYEIDLLLVSNKGVYIKDVPKNVNLITIFNIHFIARVLAYLHKKYNFNIIQKFLLKMKVKKHYDVGICFLDGDVTDLLLLIPGIDKKVAWVHSSYITNNNFYKFYKNKSYKNKLIKNRYNNLDSICFVSEDSKTEFIEVFGEYKDMRVIYNIVDAKAVIDKAKKETLERNKVFTFIALGSLMTVKGFDRLIRAAEIIKKNNYKFQLQIFGIGKEQNNLEKLINDNDLNDTVKLMGFSNNPYPYLKAADVFVMSSVSEALPTALCEAMILGKPVITTNCSGCRELVDYGKYGLMAEQDDAELAERMMDYLRNPDLLEKYSQLSFERSAIFNESIILEKYYDIFNL
jgi:glycosyltransferase involved in cell wall biosynthesis